MFDTTEKENKLTKVFSNVDCIAETMTKVCQFIWCAGFDQFTLMYQKYGIFADYRNCNCGSQRGAK